MTFAQSSIWGSHPLLSIPKSSLITSSCSSETPAVFNARIYSIYYLKIQAKPVVIQSICIWNAPWSKSLRRAQVHAHVQMRIQASAFPLMACPSARLLHHRWGRLCVHAGSTCARIPPAWSNSILIYSNLNLFQKGRRQSYFSAVGSGGGSYHAPKYSIQDLLTQTTCSMKDRPVHFASSFSPLISCVWVLSKSHFLSLSVSPYLEEHTGLWESAVSGRAARVWPRGAVGAP